MKKSRSGFTIVELLVVVVVIAILAAIVVSAYNGVQARSRDAKRRTDVANIIKAMELYYNDTGSYPVPIANTGSVINNGWYTSGDSSWNMLSTLLTTPNISGSAAIDSLPVDPRNTTTAPIYGGYSYAIYVAQGLVCGTGTAKGQMYLIAYRLENGKQEFNTQGPCTSNNLGDDYYTYKGASVYRNVKAGS